MKCLRYFILLILLAVTVSANEINITPSKLFFDNVLMNGYAEETIRIATDSTETVQITFYASEPIKPWISFEPSFAHFNKNNPVEIKVIVKPFNNSLGKYQGFILINSLSGKSKITSATITSLTIETTVKLTDKEITQAIIDDIIVKDVEKNNPIKVLVKIKNQGNIGISPYFNIDILNLDKGKVLKSATSKEISILPFASDSIKLDLENNLNLGIYWARVSVLSEEGLFIGKQLIKFNVVKPGTLPLEEEPVYIFQEEPIPLGMSGIFIVVGFVILLLIIRQIVKKNVKEEESSSDDPYVFILL